MDSEGPPARDSASPSEEPTPPDLQQWMDTVWTHVFGFPARAADVAVVRQISDETFESRVDAIADLLWDHWMGEPDDPSEEQVREFVVNVGQEMAKAANDGPAKGS